MKRIKIFCEGITDQIFIADCIELFYTIKTTREIIKEGVKISFDNGGEIIEVGGCSKLTNDLYIQKMRDNIVLDGINLVIFDADYSNVVNGTRKISGNNGFNSCEQKLKNIGSRYKVDFSYMIWPDNESDGEIEDLLISLIPESKNPILDCIKNHQNCLENSGIQEIRIPELKDTLGYYLHTLIQDSRAGKRNYKDIQFWEMNLESNPKLKIFKEFLDQFFL